MSPRVPLPWLCVLTGLAVSGAVRAGGQVTVYRCQTGAGQVTLGDVPCPAGQRQEIREMSRPQDRPPATTPLAAPKPLPPPPAAPIVREMVVDRIPARPMYACTTDEGKTYTSDNGDGNPRLAPIWSLGYPGAGTLHRRHPDGGTVVIGSTWIHDPCHQLPQAEACDRLRDRRYEIQREYHSALQSDRQRLDKEQRGIDARLDNDCGAG